LASRAEIVLVSLPTPAIVTEVILGERGVARGTQASYVIDLSTTGPDTEKRIARELAGQGKVLIDAPVSGGVAGARAGSLAIMAACSDRDLVRVSPVLNVLGKLHHVAAEAGMGQMMKLVNNLMSASALAISSEALTLAVKAGLDPEVVIRVCNAGSGRNSATLDKFPRQILPRTFDAGFTMGLMSKDVDLCMAQAETLGLYLDVCRVVQTVWKNACVSVGSREDFTKIIVAIEGPAGVTVAGRSSGGGRG
jgi:3-hydroxyisobutyrate dehydrogenase-like beta-hydroxyacid dehydrogenase